MKEEPGVTVQPSEKSEPPEIGALADSDISRIVTPGALPILGEVGGWNALHIGQSGHQPGVVPIDDRLEVSASDGIFKPMIEPDEFILHLSGLSSFNIPEILSGGNELPGFPEDLPILDEGLTDILVVQPGGIPEQIPGMTGIAPILSIPHPTTNPVVMRQVVGEPEPSLQSIKPIIPPTPSPQVPSIGRSDQWMGINQPGSLMTILLAAESILPISSKTLPLFGNFETSENVLINSFNYYEYPEFSLGEVRPERSAITDSNLDSLVELPGRSAISESLQIEKEILQPSSADISTPLDKFREVRKSDIGRMVDTRLVDTTRKPPPEIEPSSLIYLNGRPVFSAKEEEKQFQVEGTSDRMERNPTWIGLSPTRLENLQTTIRVTDGAEPVLVNRQPIHLASSPQNLILRQSRPPEEMVLSVPIAGEESESGQVEPSLTTVSPLNSLEMQELNFLEDHDIENASLAWGKGQPVERTRDREAPVGNFLQTIGIGYNPAGFLQRIPLVNGLNRTEESVSRFTLSRQIPGMSMLENRARNTTGEVNQEMQTVQSEGMPLINQKVSSGNEMALGGGLPQMPLPPTIGETLPSLNAVIGSTGQNIPELVDKTAPKIEKPEIPQMPSIDRLTDQIWQQIQRRLQIERERSKGMA